MKVITCLTMNVAVVHYHLPDVNMAISATTDWAKMRHIMQMVFFTSALLASTVGQGLPTSGKVNKGRAVFEWMPKCEFFQHKRQLFREHLLPARGGKIPQDAFLLDRISLNRLNQIGAFNSEGNLLERPPLEGVRYHDQLAKTIKVGGSQGSSVLSKNSCVRSSFRQWTTDS